MSSAKRSKVSVKAKDKEDQNSTISSRAGLTLPIRRVEKIAKNTHGLRQGKHASVVMTGVVECATLELIKDTIKETIKTKHSRITPKFIDLAIQNNPELNSYYKDFCISGGSVQVKTFDYNLKTNKKAQQDKRREERNRKKILRELQEENGVAEEKVEEAPKKTASVGSKRKSTNEPQKKKK